MNGTATFRQAKIAFSDEGGGRAIVLLHGFPENKSIWKEFSKELAKSFRVIAIDLPGFGGSDCIGYVHTMELMAQSVNAVMRHLELRRYILAGHSMGGYVALAYAELFPENLRGLCLFHSSSWPDTPEKKEDRIRSIALIKEDKNRFLKLFTANLFAEEKSPYNSKLQRIVSRSSQRGLVAALEGMKIRKGREMVMKFMEYPVLFIIGAKDKVIQPEVMLQQAEIPPKKEILLLPDAGHEGFYEAKEETLNAIRKFARHCFREKVRFN